jgi:hypothetical protein
MSRLVSRPLRVEGLSCYGNEVKAVRMQLDKDSVEHRCRGRRKRAQGYQCRQHGGSSEGKGFVLAVLCHNLHVDLFRFLLCLCSFHALYANHVASELQTFVFF